MDRQKKDELPKMQVGFVDFVCMPLYKVLSDVAPELTPLLDGLESNRKSWDMLAKDPAGTLFMYSTPSVTWSSLVCWSRTLLIEDTGLGTLYFSNEDNLSYVMLYFLVNLHHCQCLILSAALPQLLTDPPEEEQIVLPSTNFSLTPSPAEIGPSPSGLVPPNSSSDGPAEGWRNSTGSEDASPTTSYTKVKSRSQNAEVTPTRKIPKCHMS